MGLNTCKAGKAAKELLKAGPLHHKDPLGVEPAAPAHNVAGGARGLAGGPAGGETADKGAIQIKDHRQLALHIRINPLIRLQLHQCVMPVCVCTLFGL